MKTYRNTGRVVNKLTRSGVSGARVEAWDSEHVSLDMVAYAVTDHDGGFSMSLTEDDVRSLFLERRARVYFRVIAGTDLLADTEETITWWIKGSDGRELILVDPSKPIETGLTLAPFVVRGHLYEAAEGPLRGTTVKAFDRNLRSETELGTATTDARGGYSIQYTAAGITHPGKMRADLLVRAVTSRGATIAEAPVRCHAPPTVVIDLVANGTTYRGRSEHDDVKTRVEQAAGATDVGTLTAEEIEQIACSIQLDAALVAAYSNAVRLETELRLSEVNPLFYALLRQGLPAERRKLLTTPPAQLRRALEQSSADNIVGPAEPEMLDQALAILRRAAVDLAFETPDPGTTANFGHVIGLALRGESDPTAAARTFVDRYTAHEGTIEEFWRSVETAFSPATIARLQLSLQWGSLTRHHKPLMDELEVRRAAGTATTLKDLARYDESDWLAIIDELGTTGTPTVYPADVPGTTAAEKRTNYARILTDTMETAFPTVAIHDRVYRTEGDGTDLWKFLQNNGGFEFGKTRVNQFIAGSPDLRGVGDTNALKKRLQRMERVFKLTPKYPEMKRLLDDGRHSALSIERMGKARFTAEYAKDFGACKAEAIFERACYVAAAATHLLQKYSAATNGISYQVLPNKVAKYQVANQPPATEVAEWEELFGSLDFCACERCRSVHGPAAYLVDLLQFLDKQYVSLTKTAKGVLLGMRPDIARIELSCDNTNIALPQVDLNIEIMERAVAGSSPPPPAIIKSTGTTDELLAMPEVIDDGARQAAATALADAVFPWALPFAMPGEEARVYLDHMGMSRWRLMEALQSAAEGPSDDEIAQEHLGMSSTERELVLGTHLGTAQSYWGLTEGTWADELARVNTFLKQSGLSYDELRELVDSAFLDGLGTPVLTPDEGSDGCDLAKVSITGLDTPLEATWGAVHRFLRLRRRLAWTVTEVDQSVQALNAPRRVGAGTIDAALLRSLSALVRLREQVRVPLPELLSWWADIDTRARPETKKPSLYDRLFLNKAVQNQPDAAFSPLPGGGGLLSDHKKPILAALQMSETDFQLLTVDDETRREVTLPRPLPDDNFTLHNLSLLHRVASLARALKLSVREVLILRALTGDAPLAGLLPVGSSTAGPASARVFVERVHRLRAAGWRVAELHYLLRHVTQPSEGVGPEDALRTRRREELEAGLKKIVDATVFTSDPTGAALERLLTELLTITMEDASPGELRSAVSEVFDLIKGVPIMVDPGEPEKDPPVPPTFLSDDDRRGRLVDYLDKLVDEADLPLAIVVLPQDPPLDPPPDPDLDFTLEVTRIDQVHARLLDFVRRRDSDGLIKEKLSQWFKLDGPSVDVLLQRLTLPDPETSIQVHLRPPIDLNEDDVDELRDRALLRFTKAATVVTRLKLRADELTWILEHAAEQGWLDFNALPLEQAQPNADLGTARAMLAGLERLMDVVALAGRLKGGPTTLFDLFRLTMRAPLPTESKFHEELAMRTGWRLKDVEELADRFNFTFPDDYRNEIALRRLADAMDMQKRLGATPAGTLIGWTPVDVTPSIATEIRLVAKAKHAPEDWLTVARPLRDVLREKQRASLVAYLVNKFSPDDLMGKLLVDVEMTCCQLTSRIKHAIGSVQLFVQRAFLNLSTVHLGPQAAKEWSWMKSFVAWEAARKVFLYPENWIEPELRDGKSPFFKQLESQLLQNEITDEHCEQAYLGYLDKLDEVARLDVVGMCRHQETDGEAIDVLHVFGRTEGIPHSYFHRTRVDSSCWTPWTKVDLEIPGEHILPAVVDRRLHLYWPIFEDAPDPDEEQDPPDDVSPPRPRIHLEIKIAATQLRGERWLAPCITAGPAVTYQDGPYDSVARDRLMLGFEPGEPYSILVGDASIAYHVDVAGRFESRGCRGELVLGSVDPSQAMIDIPPDAKISFNDYVQAFLPKLHMAMNVDGERQNVPLLKATPTAWRIQTARRWRSNNDPADWVETDQFFFKDKKRTFFVHIEPITTVTYNEGSLASPDMGAPMGECSVAGSWDPTTSVWIKNESTERLYVFDTFYHPYVCRFLKELTAHGPDGLRQWSKFDPRLQLLNEDSFDDYDPNGSYVAKDPPYRPMEDVDFSFRGAYSLYNWELFFHIPFMIATRLAKNQRFAEAQKWFHAIFNPTDGSNEESPQRFWKVRPFYENRNLANIQEEMLNLAEQAQNKDSIEQWFLLHPPDDEAALAAAEIVDEITAWRKQPFNPHLLARMRPIAYQKATVMRYLDNLIEWGDQLFRRDTIESINEASQLYILAQTILGDRPRAIPARNVTSKTYAQLQADLDEFSNAIESLVPIGMPGSKFTKLNGKLVKCEEHQPTPMVHTLYFCVPQNEKLLGYWDTVADRLFKIRNCMNIEGVVRELPLFEPPVDPALLVAAAAAGVDIGSVLNDLAGPPPIYRFQVLHAKAMELCSGVAGHAASLLAALEKRDAEELSLLRSGQEIELLTMVRDVRLDQVKEASENVKALELSRKVIEQRRDYYRDVEFMNVVEIGASALEGIATVVGAIAQGIESGAAATEVAPDQYVGGAGMASPVSITHVAGGSKAGAAAGHGAQALSYVASVSRDMAGQARTMGGYVRRWEDWKLQERVADVELKQIDKQIAVSRIRLEIARKELANHERQIENARQVEDFLKSKYTNQDLYAWMVEQTSVVYFQSYQLAYDMAKRAEKGWQFERGEPSTKFLKFGYWDSLKKGLMSAEKLQYDLRRMESAYLAQNKREYEITKHVSLAEVFPESLLQLRAGVSAEIELTEAHFDLDYPGHYMRRIKSLSMTVAAVTGPYTGVNCTLTQLKSVIRKDKSAAGDYTLDANGGDSRGLYNFAPIQSICTSSGQNDAGLFELNFRDERFLPFEGAGAVGRFRIEMPPDQNRFDLNTLTDVVLHVRYMARDGGALLKEKARDALDNPAGNVWQPRSAFRLFSARRDFPKEWERFLTTLEAGNNQVLHLPMNAERLPYLPGSPNLTITEVRLAASWNDDLPPTTTTTMGITNGVGATSQFAVQSAPALVTLTPPTPPGPQVCPAAPGEWRLTIAQADLMAADFPASRKEQVPPSDGRWRIKATAIDDIYILVVVE
jgi:hypothetical protein